MKKIPIVFTALIILFMVVTVFGLAYLLYMQFIFPSLVPLHGGGELVTLNSANNYTYQITWTTNSRLHLALQTNETVDLYANNEYLCKCKNYEFMIEPDDSIDVTLESDSSVTGRFTAWQETPVDKQALGFAILYLGLFGIVISIIALKKLTYHRFFSISKN